jgi:hypothetical protein
MFGRNFGEKCIMMQFLGMEKDGKLSQRRVRRAAEKKFEGEQGREKMRDAPGRLEGGPYAFSAKSFISNT